MNNKIFSRLEGLMKRLGFSTKPGGITRAETAAYAAAVSLADEIVSKAFKNIFISTMEEYGILMYSSLIGIEYQKNTEEIKNKIISRISQNYSMLRQSDYISATDREFFLNGNSEIGMKFEFLPDSKENLNFLSYINKNYFPVYRGETSTSDGLCWKSFETLDLRWYEIDGYELPFRIYDTLMNY
ncbi:MAG: hypothetical protein LUG21_07525 [Clostridiales bacterium]|nr:hypothetical protein [Clostridiales bacterium]